MRMQEDLLSPDLLQNPQTYLGHLRDNDPLHWNPKWKGWLVTRHDDVLKVLRNSDAFSADAMAPWSKSLDGGTREKYGFLIDYFSKMLVFTDPPYHTRMRALINKAFTPTRVEKLRPRIREILNELLSRVERKGSMEFIDDFSFHLPAIVICEFMGVPLKDREKVRAWSNEVTYLIHFRLGDTDRHDRAQKGLEQLVAYFEPLVHERKKNSKDDLISVLVQAQNREDILSDEEILATCVILMIGGHETTTNLLADGLALLMQNRDQWDRLRKNPGLIVPAVEEILRCEGPVKAIFRHTKVDVNVGDATIRGADRVLLMMPSANRDPAKFHDADLVDITRTPNPHTSFGYGIHFCIGAPLARLEAQEAFLALTQRLPNIHLATNKLEYQPTVIMRALKELPVEW